MTTRSTRRSAASKAFEGDGGVSQPEVTADPAGGTSTPDDDESGPAPRRGSRAKKPSRAKLDASELGSVATKATSAASKGRAAKAAKEDEDDPAGPYCICKGVDDGTPMICCAECEDWFHFACIGLVQKTASQISVYICEDCQKKTGKTSEFKASRKAAKPAAKGKAPVKKGKGKSSTAGPDDGDSDFDESAAVLSGEDEEMEDEDGAEQDNYVPETKTRKGSLKRKAADETESTAVSSSSSSSLPSKKSRSSVSSASGSAARKASSSGAVIDPQSQAVRAHAVAQFSTVLARIFAETSLEGVEFMTLSSDAVLQKDAEASSKAYAQTLEETLFELHGERNASGHKTTGKQYKDKFRTFVFNLKDKGNGALHLRIASGQLDAASLARLTNDELANDAIRLTVEKSKREALEQSIMKREAAPMRKMTHKGEVDIEFDSGTTESSRLTESRREKEEKEERDRRASGASTVRPAAGHQRSPSANQSPVVERRFSRGVNDSPEVGSPVEEKPNDIPKRSASPAAPSAHDNSGVDISSLFASSGPSGGVIGEDDFGMADGAFPADGSEIADWDRAGDSAIDDFLGNDPVGGDEAAAQPERSTTPDTEPTPDAFGLTYQLTRLPIAWRGAFTMPEQGTFSGSIRHIAGRDVGLEPQGWSQFLPTDYITIEGRLPSDAAMKYLVQSRFSSRTEIVVLALKPSFEPVALAKAPANLGPPASETDNLTGFRSVFEYFSKRQRYGVLPRSAEAQRLIKDLYIVPLAEDEPIPEWLELLESTGFAGPRAKRREADMMLIVAVLFRTERRDVSTPVASSAGFSGSPYLPAAGAGGMSPGGSAAQAGALNDLLSKGPNALQDLLRTLSSTSGAPGSSPMPTGPAAMSATAPSPQNPHSSPQSHGAVGNNLQSTASAMLSMPAPALENMLHSNPALVDSLLSSLKGGSLGASPAGPPPPGPPPPPPQAPGPPPSFPPAMAPGPPQYGRPPQQQSFQPPHPQHQGYQGPPAPRPNDYGHYRPPMNGYPPQQGGPPGPQGYGTGGGGWGPGQVPPGQAPYQAAGQQQGWGRPPYAGSGGGDGRGGRGGRGRGGGRGR